METLSTYGHPMGLVSHGTFQYSAPKLLPRYPGTFGCKVHRTFQAILVGFRVGCQNFGAFFRETLKTSRGFSIEIRYIEGGQCCPPIFLTSTKQHATKKRILVVNWISESLSKDTLLAMLMLKKIETLVLTTKEARNNLWRANLFFHAIIREPTWTHSDVQREKNLFFLVLNWNGECCTPLH